MQRNRGKAGAETRGSRWGARWIAVVVASVMLAVANPVAADHYDQDEAGHPLRIVAYFLHPVGVAIDYLLMRPAHWLVSHEPFKTAFGHED